MRGIRIARKVKGWNQAELAEASGLDQSYISKVERGWDGATVRSLSLIAQALEVPIHQLFLEDREASEIKLLEIFRSLPEERQQGWLDMLSVAEAQNPTEDQ